MAGLKQLAKRAYRHVPFKRPLFAALRSLAPPLPARLYRHLHFDGPFTVGLGEGRKFAIHSHGSIIENELFWAGYGNSWEAMSLQVWAALCSDRTGTILDIGANTGVYALAAQALAPGARVVAVEPVARVAEKLGRNVRLNGGRIDIVEAAISDHDGRMMLSDIESEHNYSASLEGQGPDAASYPVEVRALDSLLAADWPAAVGPIKIDIERHEPAAIRGMAETLRRYRPPMLIEVLDSDIGAAIEAGLRGLGYRYWHIDEDRGLIPTAALAPLGGHHWNHLLCTEEEFAGRNLQRLLAG